MVRVSSSKKGYLGLSRLVGGVAGDLDVTAKKLGNENFYKGKFFGS